MDPKFLEELQKLKEEKNADLENTNLDQLNIPDFEDVEVPDDTLGAEMEEEISGGTIQFQPITKTEPEQTQAPSGGRRVRKTEKPEIDEETRLLRTKIRNTILISTASVIAAILILFTAFFGIRNANMKKYTYQYLGMGLSIDDGIKEYSLFGNLKKITQYGETGQICAIAEFKKGNCIKETAYTSGGSIDYYFTHEYDNGYRILSSYYKDGQVIQSVKYTITEEGKILAESTYYLEDNRTETAFLTLTDTGNLLSAEYYTDTVLTHRDIYGGTLVAETIYYDEAQNITNRVVYEYNDAKQLLTQTEYDKNNNIQERIVNQYNNKNLLTKTIQYDGAGKILEYDTYNYDLSNNPIKQVTYAGDGTMKRQLLKVFNDKNQITKETNLNADGSIAYCYGYDYDEKGYSSKTIVYNTQNTAFIDEYTLFTRNESGTIIESDIYNSTNTLIEKSKFNDAGFLTELFKFNDSGTLKLEQKSKYDSKQRLIEKSVTNFSDTGEKIDSISEQYNEKGFVTMQTKEVVADNLYEQFLFAYHNDGWKTQETLFNKSGKTVYDRFYNDKGQIYTETLYENGTESFFNEYIYNEKNQVLEKRSLDSATKVLTKTTYAYNEAGILIESFDTDILNTPLVKKQYDESGHVVRQAYYNNEGMIESYDSFEYDELNRVIVKESLGEDEKLLYRTVYYYREDGGYDYTLYDEHGVAIEDSRGPEYLPNNDKENTSSDNPTNPDQNTETTDSNSENKTTDSATSSNTDSGNSSTESATQSDTNTTDPESENSSSVSE